MNIKTRLMIVVVAIMACHQIKAQHNMTLNERKQGLVTIAALEAKGDVGGLAKHIDVLLDGALTVNEIKEALSQLYAYTGFPRSLNALGTLQKVVAERNERGANTVEGRDASPLPDGYNALKQGTEIQTSLTGKPFDYTFAPATDYYLKAHLFGDIFVRDNLSHSDRELVTIGAISALPGCEPQLLAHVGGSLNMGVSKDELRAIPEVLVSNVGQAESMRAAAAVAQVLGEKPADKVQTVDFSVWPKGELNTAYAKYFIGNSYLAPLDAAAGGPVNVTFEPRCRNNWHIHHNGVQVLVCVAGRGWYQEWGKDAVKMTPGTVIAIPSEAKHWHGAARDSWFQHVTYMTKVGDGASNEWLEPVTDDVYDILP